MLLPSSGPEPILYLVAIIVSGGSLFAAFRTLHRKRLIDDTPTLKAQGVFIGLVELKGTVECEKPLRSYLSETRCVQYSWSIEEYWSRQVTETYQDAEGKTQTRTRTETGWTNIGHGGESTPFYLKDETGIIRIIPEHASIDGDTVISKTIGRADPLYFGKGPLHGVANSQHRRRFTETLIPLHSPIYVIGHTRERDDIVAVEIAYDEEEPLFVISTSSEEEVSRGYGYWFYIWIILGSLPALMWSLSARTSPEIMLWVIPVLLYIVALALGWTLVVYNSLVSLRNSVEQAWSMVDIQLKRRSDLIPNLVRIVEGYQMHEETQASIAKLRAQSINDSNKKPELEGAAPILEAVIENYPELLAGQRFLELQHSLEETEERIALARDYYNDMANFYNTRLEVIPDMLVAKLAGLRQRPLLVAENFKRASVDVDLVA